MKEPRSHRPHIVLITCHDIGRYIGCYGVRTVHTPHLDRLAATGVRFDRAFTVAPSCSPSRAALATGRYPHSNGVMGLAHPPFGWSLHLDEWHLAAILADQGYETHLFGLQHVTHRVDELGFNYLHGFDPARGCHEHAIGRNVTARLAEFLSEPLSGAPLYLEINLEEPHRPYDQGGARPDGSLGVTIPRYLPDSPETREEMAELQGAIRQADDAVGEILAMLDDAGLDGNTLTIFSADHGLAMPRAKCTLYDPGLEIALLMRWAEGGLGAARVVSELISNVDVLPTILDAVHVPVPGSVQGRSFFSLLRGDAYLPRSEIFAEKTYHSYYDPMRAIRTERFKFIRNVEVTYRVEVPGDVQRGAIFRSRPWEYTDAQHPPTELYDLDGDPLELDNMSGEPDYREVEEDLSRRLRNWMAETGDPLLKGWIPSPQAEALQATARSPAPETHRRPGG
jgi:arylsulfatase A-like enzyme